MGAEAPRRLAPAVVSREPALSPAEPRAACPTQLRSHGDPHCAAVSTGRNVAVKATSKGDGLDALLSGPQDPPHGLCRRAHLGLHSPQVQPRHVALPADVLSLLLANPITHVTLARRPVPPVLFISTNNILPHRQKECHRMSLDVTGCHAGAGAERRRAGRRASITAADDDRQCKASPLSHYQLSSKTPLNTTT